MRAMRSSRARRWSILANAHAAGQLLGDGSLPLVVTRGQVSFLAQPAGAVLHAPVCREGFITPAVGGLHCIGASYQVGIDDLSERIDDHLGNLERLRRVLPDYAADTDPSVLTGRVAPAHHGPGSHAGHGRLFVPSRPVFMPVWDSRPAV